MASVANRLQHSTSNRSTNRLVPMYSSLKIAMLPTIFDCIQVARFEPNNTFGQVISRMQTWL